MKLGVDEFLSRLPKSVIRDGKVISIRDDIKSMVKKSGSSVKEEDGETGSPSKKKNVIVADTHVVAMMAKATAPDGDNGGSNDVPKKDVTTLAIKSSNGGQTLIVKLVRARFSL